MSHLVYKEGSKSSGDPKSSKHFSKVPKAKANETTALILAPVEEPPSSIDVCLLRNTLAISPDSISTLTRTRVDGDVVYKGIIFLCQGTISHSFS